MTQYIKTQKTDKVLDLQETKWVKQEHYQTSVIYFAGSLILFYNGYLFLSSALGFRGKERYIAGFFFFKKK